jgi:acyl-coenzyme A synthetase/AMP-(fatty) acid ligase
VGDISVADLDRHARATLAGHKRPKDYRLVESLPYTATGKLQRNAVAAAVGLG